MNTDLVILKIGGNTVSPKDTFRKVEQDVVREVAKAVKRVLREGTRLIILHGGGSHAHTPSRCYGVIRTFDKDNMLGISIIKTLLKELNIEICKIFIRYGIPVLPFDTCSLLREDGNIDTYTIYEALESGFIPLLHGDITSVKGRPLIVSSDDLMYILAEKFRPRLAVFVIREKGILDKNGKTIPVLSKESIRELKILQNESYVDVTGGLMKKLDICFKLSKICNVYICPYSSDILYRVISRYETHRCDECTQVS